MKKEKRGDWPEALDVLDEDEAKAIAHDSPPPPEPDDVEKQRADVRRERREGHPSDHHRENDPELD